MLSIIIIIIVIIIIIISCVTYFLTSITMPDPQTSDRYASDMVNEVIASSGISSREQVVKGKPQDSLGGATGEEVVYIVY